MLHEKTEPLFTDKGGSFTCGEGNVGVSLRIEGSRDLLSKEIR